MSYNFRQKRTQRYQDTMVINAFEKYILEIPDQPR